MMRLSEIVGHDWTSYSFGRWEHPIPSVISIIPGGFTSPVCMRLIKQRRCVTLNTLDWDVWQAVTTPGKQTEPLFYTVIDTYIFVYTDIHLYLYIKTQNKNNADSNKYCKPVLARTTRRTKGLCLITWTEGFDQKYECVCVCVSVPVKKRKAYQST